jgi:glycosyltransferase involved in cell wall biosynthesis
MKILMLLESEFPPDIRVENEISSLTEAGHEVHLACTTRKNRPPEERINNAVIHRKGMSAFIYKSSVGSLKFPFYFNYWRRYISRLLEKEKFDAIHVHDLPLSRIGAEVKMKYKLPLVIDLHENWPGLLSISPHTKTVLGKLLCNINQWKNYEKKYVSYADRIIVVVQEAKERIMKLSVPEEKIIVVSNTLNLRDFVIPPETKSKSPGKKILIYEGGINFHRGIQYVLEALSKIRHLSGKIEFWIIGSGSFLKDLKLLSSELQLDDIVRFMGWQPQEKVFEFINMADSAIIPHIKCSHSDSTIPHKLFHYMYAGLPILVSDCDPLKRIINETSGGYVYTFDDTDTLAGKIEFLLNTESSLKRTDGKEWVIRKYNWDVDKERLINIYDGLEKEI